MSKTKEKVEDLLRVSARFCSLFVYSPRHLQPLLQPLRDVLASELTAAGTRTNCRERAPNNEQRKRCYREVAKCLYEDLYGKRRRLPHCIVARIRAIWPSETGLYMGFKLK